MNAALEERAASCQRAIGSPIRSLLALQRIQLDVQNPAQSPGVDHISKAARERLIEVVLGNHHLLPSRMRGCLDGLEVNTPEKRRLLDDDMLPRRQGTKGPLEVK